MSVTDFIRQMLENPMLMVSTVLTYAATVTAVRLTLRLMARRGEKRS